MGITHRQISRQKVAWAEFFVEQFKQKDIEAVEYNQKHASN